MTSWVEALKDACNKTSQAKVAQELGVSKAMICLALKGKYAGDTQKLEHKVRGRFMENKVYCPVVMEDITTDRCLKEQETPFSTSNSLRIAFYKQCKSCPNKYSPEPAEKRCPVGSVSDSRGIINNSNGDK